MHRFFVKESSRETLTITGAAARHISIVLRMQPGAKLQLVTGDGLTQLAEIVSLSPQQVQVRRLEFLPESHEPSVKLSLLQGLAKGDKMDFIIQKAVELGVSAIYPVAMENAVVKLDAAKAAKKVERWQKIAAAAAQQSKRDFIPTVHAVLDFKSALAASGSELLLLAYEEEQQAGLRQVLQEHPEAQSLAIIIGPEGGIAPAELQAARAAGAASVSLGPRILRTETAGLVAAAAIFYETGNLG